MVLVDTSVWVDHWRRSDAVLVSLLHEGEVACHPFILGELACGNLHDRGQVIDLLAALPALPKSDDQEVLFFIAQHRLMGTGLGLVDVHLLASCALAAIPLWTRDANLRHAAGALSLDSGQR